MPTHAVRLARVALGVVAAAALAACASGAGAAPSWTFETTPVASQPVAQATPVATLDPTDPAPNDQAATLGFTPGTVAAPRIITILAGDDLAFQPGAIVVAEGETVTFKVKVTGKAAHEFMVGPAADVFADKEGTPELEDLKPGTTHSITYTFNGPGPFAFACHEPGHYEAGMEGWIIVAGPDVPKVGTKDDPRLVLVTMDDELEFVPDSISVAPGETVDFILTNVGKATHEFQIGPADMVAADEVDGKLDLEADNIGPGTTTHLIYSFDASAGPFTFACHEPGHYEAGMKGTISIAGS